MSPFLKLMTDLIQQNELFIPFSIWLKICYIFKESKQEIKQLRLVCKNSEIAASIVLFSKVKDIRILQDERLSKFVSIVSLTCFCKPNLHEFALIKQNCTNLTSIKLGCLQTKKDYVYLKAISKHNLYHLTLQDIDAQEMQKSFIKLPNLQQLTISGISNGPLIIHCFFPNITKLNIAGNHDEFNLSGLKNLKTLVYDNYSEHENEILFKMNPKLEHLYIFLRFLHPELKILSSVRQISHQLKTLSLNNIKLDKESFKQFCQIDFKSLKVLHLNSSNAKSWLTNDVQCFNLDYISIFEFKECIFEQKKPKTKEPNFFKFNF